MSVFWLILPLLAPPAGVTWVAEPQAIGEGIEPALLQTLGLSFCEELAKSASVLSGREALLERATPLTDPGKGLQAARTLLADGEELYMAFKFDAAAGMLAKSADLFNDSLADLNSDDLKMLYRARLLAGLSWFEAGKIEVARQAFIRLIVIRPDFEPDPTLVSPKAREVFRQALSEVRAAGVGSLEVRTQPEGAEVTLDGLARGNAPLTITPLAGDRHSLKLSLPGYQTHREEFEMRPPEKVSRQVKLEPTLTLTARERLLQAARQGQPPEVAAADLDLIARTARLSAIVLVGIARQPGGELLITARRWSPAGETATAAVLARESDLAQAARKLAASLRLPTVVAPVVVHLDFSKILLGVDPRWKVQAVEPEEQGGLLSRWWFWTGVALLAGGLTAGIVVLASPDSPPPDHARFLLDF